MINQRLSQSIDSIYESVHIGSYADSNDDLIKYLNSYLLLSRVDRQAILRAINFALFVDMAIQKINKIDFNEEPLRFEETVRNVFEDYISVLPEEIQDYFKMAQSTIDAHITEQLIIQIDFKKNPEIFEVIREKCIKSRINTLPSDRQKGANWEQSRIENELSKFHTPLGRWQRMQEMFIDEVFQSESGFIKTRGGILNNHIRVETRSENSPGKVIPIISRMKDCDDK